MTQEELNQAEWRNPDNWSSRGLLGLYFSKRDTRVWVPKAMPSLGWTPNLACPGGAYTLIGLLLLPTIVLAALLISSVP